MPSAEFLRPRYCGARFERGGLPLDVLGDLAAFNQLLVEVAKWCFLREHADRRRAPKGFGRGIACRMTGIERGSVTPIITLSTGRSDQHGARRSHSHYYEMARDSIIDAIGAAEMDDLSRCGLTGKHLVYFRKIGRGLGNDEAIEFSASSRKTAVQLTQTSRARLVRESHRRLQKGTSQVLTSATLRGRIPEVDRGKMTFEMQLRDGRRVTGPVVKDYSSVVFDAFNHYNKSRKVRVHASVRYKGSRPDQVETVEKITILDKLDVGAQLDDLWQLKRGWMNGEGVPPNQEGLAWLENQFSRHFRCDDLSPHIYPTLAGGVQAEWTLGTREVSLEVNLLTHQAEWYWVDVSSDDEEGRMLDLDDRSSWGWLCDRLCQMAESDIG